jgi:hypothetical protein
MAYEFADGEPAEAIPTTPDFLHLKAERICQVVPFEALFVKHFSVVEDPKTWQLGVDTNDPLPDSTDMAFENGPEPIGLMRIASLEDTISGYLIDLRYARKLIQRPLDFDYSVYRDEDPNMFHKTVPVLGAIFHDPEQERLRLRTQHKDFLKGFAVGLMSFVDVERAKRGVTVWAHTTPSELERPNTVTNLGVAFSSGQQETKPDTDQSVTIDGE